MVDLELLAQRCTDARDASAAASNAVAVALGQQRRHQDNLHLNDVRVRQLLLGLDHEIANLSQVLTLLWDAILAAKMACPSVVPVENAVSDWPVRES